MAFVPALSVHARRMQSGGAVGECALTPERSVHTLGGQPYLAPRMGYGDYSLGTDQTKGQVGQYYVDKFRTVSDFAKRGPVTAGDAIPGRDVKGRILVPEEGIPQISEGILARDPRSPEDPRVAEAKGEVYWWDREYRDPAFLPSSFADVNDEEVQDEAFRNFRASLQEERGNDLSKAFFASQEKIKELKTGLSERYMLTLEGQLDKEHARIEKINDMPFFTPTGQPQTEIPGIPFMPAVSALDFQNKPGEGQPIWMEGGKFEAGQYVIPMQENLQADDKLSRGIIYADSV